MTQSAEWKAWISCSGGGIDLCCWGSGVASKAQDVE